MRSGTDKGNLLRTKGIVPNSPFTVEGDCAFAIQIAVLALPQMSLEPQAATGHRQLMVVEDDPFFGPMMVDLLESGQYKATWYADGLEALAQAMQTPPDLILLDVSMPSINGFELCKRLKATPETRDIPVLMLTAHGSTHHVVEGLSCGADDYLTKPAPAEELFARIKTHLRIREYQHSLALANGNLQSANDELARINTHLDQLVTEKVAELSRESRLRQFFSPKVAESIVKAPDGLVLTDHRREVTVLFFDLRGFTTFVESADGPTVMSMLREFHAVAGPIIFAHDGTLERFMGDGMMVYFGDPDPHPDHANRAVRTAIEVRDAFIKLQKSWLQKNILLGLGAGIATGEALLGQIGFEGRHDYAALGIVTNTAARLCDIARPGQILLASRTVELVSEQRPRAAGKITLKGFSNSLTIFEV